MNKKLGPIFARRSVRKYSSEVVSDDVLKDLLEAAMAAPSAVAKDPWHFVVVKDKAVLAKLTAGLPNGPMLASAGAGIVVCGDAARAHSGLESYMIQDCSAATENILIAASMLGLGACWLGTHPRMDRVAHVRSVLGIPESIVAIAVIAVGWPAETPAPRTRYSESQVHRGRW